MAKPPVSDHNNTSDHLKTWILKVYIHCEGCKKKVLKILQSIEGVYKTVIDAKEHKVTVTGSVNVDTLVQKLLKSGKQVEILPESFESIQPKKKKQNKKQNDDVPTSDEIERVDIDDEKEKSEVAKTDGENDQKVELAEAAVVATDNNNNNGGDGGKKKNKKKKKNKGDNIPPKKGNTTLESSIGIEKAGSEELNLGPPANHTVYPTPYDIPPYANNYYTTPAYGMSYNASNPSAESSYYTPPVYGYAQSHPHPVDYYPPPPPPPSYYSRSVFDDHDYESEGRLCAIM